jgi:hypothetical protein
MLKASHERAPEGRSVKRKRIVCAALCVVSCLATQGCLFQHKKPRIFVVQYPLAKVPPDPKFPVAELRPPPDLNPEPETPQALIVNLEAAMPPAPVKPAPPSRPAAAKAASVDTPTPTTAPRPAAMISEAERQRLDRDYELIVERVKKVLDNAAGKSLSADLKALENNARTFLNQAEQERQKDLPTAVSLATRADRFATDLSARLP